MVVGHRALDSPANTYRWPCPLGLNFLNPPPCALPTGATMRGDGHQSRRIAPLSRWPRPPRGYGRRAERSRSAPTYPVAARESFGAAIVPWTEDYQRLRNLRNLWTSGSQL